ncbi:diguanylate cyclase [Pseudoduganella sp. GCM10020061]|uniref:GGDEF domain-containing protein n=1 Tax=Pseudoduganella sp. GCM10020061 TaxID=3317345 RepID=UPI00363A4B2D
MDVKTMLFALALGNLVMCAALFFHLYERHKTPALGSWALARQLQAGGWLLLFLRGSGILPDLLTVPAGYALVFAGVAAEVAALRQASGASPWRVRMWIALGVAIPVYVAAFVAGDAAMRVVAGSLIMGILYFAAAAALASGWGAASALRRFMAVATALLAAVVAARGLMVLSLPEGWGWMTVPFLEVLSVGAFYLLMVLGSTGFLMIERERQQGELARLSVADTLLDVPNRRGFFNALAPWMALARRPGQPTALLVLDVDQFKRINDGYGHPAGDTVLRAIVDTCRKQLRDSDQLGRLVGVQFAVLLPRTGLADAAMVAERIRAAVEATPIKTERALVNMTVSIGATTIRADDTTVSLFKRLDDALQEAKRAGRNQVCATPAAPVALEA